MHGYTVASAVLGLGVLCAGCSGSGPRVPGTALPLLATPALLGAQSSYPAQILVTNLEGPPKITLADLAFADVSTPVVSAGSATFTVNPVAGGSTSIVVSDRTGRAVTIPVSFPLCLPPVPNVALLAENVALATPSPSPGAGTQPVRYSTIFVTAAAGTPYVTSYSLRLIGSDGTIYEGPPLAPASQAPTATGATPAPAPSGETEYFGPAPALQASTTYRVQLLGEHCLPPDVFGSFAT